jgi:hypothetical protein
MCNSVISGGTFNGLYSYPFHVENRGSKFSELASWLARSPRNIIVRMRSNPLCALKL